MAVLRVEGGRALEGRIEVDGNKNAALPLIVASLLTDAPVVLHNVPRIRDVDVLLDILEGLGTVVTGRGTTSLTLQTPDLVTIEPDADGVGRLRGSVLLLGPLVARKGGARLASPGGDFPSRRTIATHLQVLQALGARVETRPTAVSMRYDVTAPDGGLRAASFYMDEASVTATELALLAAVLAPGRTEIRHAATEPHVVELCHLLRAMGADIDGIGGARLRVTGVARLGGATQTLRGDYIEAGSWAVVAGVTGGAVEVTGAQWDDLEPITSVLQRMALDCRVEGDCLTVQPSRCRAIGRLVTGLWPGFPSDMVSLVTVLATQAEGRTLIHDWMYELRLFALEQLSSMRANLFLCDPHRIIVTGPTRLKGRRLDSRDIRSGMALIAAALCAEGESVITPVEIVERGYASVVEKLEGLGAQVERVSGGRRATDKE